MVNITSDYRTDVQWNIFPSRHINVDNVVSMSFDHDVPTGFVVVVVYHILCFSDETALFNINIKNLI